MSDFVEQLSALALWFDDQNDMPRFKLVAEAAGHFRRLTERCDAYKEALWQIAEVSDGYGPRNQTSSTTGEGHAECLKIAEEALGIEFDDLPPNGNDWLQPRLRERHAARTALAQGKTT